MTEISLKSYLVSRDDNQRTVGKEKKVHGGCGGNRLLEKKPMNGVLNGA